MGRGFEGRVRSVDPVRTRTDGPGSRGGLRTEGSLLWVLVHALRDHVRELPLERIMYA